MLKKLGVLPIAVAASLAAVAAAQAASDDRYPEPTTGYVAPAAGVAVGTVAGIGTYNAWWGTGAFASTLPTTAAGAATLGGVTGVGTVALIDSVAQPCRGFHALFGMNSHECVNGVYVGYHEPRRVYYR